MSDADHWAGCWEIHFPCALAELRRLRAEVAKLENGIKEPHWLARLRDPVPCCDTLTGPIVTHGVVLKLHGEGPTWNHANDEPPCR